MTVSAIRSPRLGVIVTIPETSGTQDRRDR
jgi:hypothetical protein